MAAMRELLTATLTLVVLWRMWGRGTSQSYSCPQCGSRDGQHGEGCTWKR